MSLEELFMIFVAWLDKKQFGYHLRDDAPEEARKAFEEYRRIKYAKKNTIVDG